MSVPYEKSTKIRWDQRITLICEKQKRLAHAAADYGVQVKHYEKPNIHEWKLKTCN